MAEGISVGEMPSFELVRGAQAKKKRHSSEESKHIKISRLLVDITLHIFQTKNIQH